MVQERYVDIGIDHGTSNSAVAVMMHGRPQMINFGGSPSMPSVVCVATNGQTFCGLSARKRFAAGALEGGLAVQKYKRAIGDGTVYRAGGGKPELSVTAAGGMVIGALLQGVTDEFPTVTPRAAVISVPAKFNEAQLIGTQEAARFAGIEYPVMIQEPVAAGMAFGLQNGGEDGRWLIFDLGAGTLDVTLLYRRLGQLEMPENGADGDSQLGGSDLDLLLAEYWLNRHDKNEYKVDQLLQRLRKAGLGNSDPPVFSFIYHIEQAKIALSEDAVVEGTFARDLESDNNKILPASPRLTREEYEPLLERFVDRAVDVSGRLLEKHRLRGQDIDGIVYIGGPTKTPYIRDQVAERLGLRIIDGVDPMTAVAEGAAIYAAGLELPEAYRKRNWVQGERPSGRLEIKAEASSLTPSYLLAGRVEPSQGTLAGATVVVQRNDGGWRSDPVPVSADGSFEVIVALIDRGKRSTLSQLIVTARGSDGQMLSVNETVNVWYPPADVPNQLAESLFVGLADGAASKVVTGGARLPFESETVVAVKTTRALRRGTDEHLRIPFYSGLNTAFGEEDSHIRSAFPCGMIVIHGRADQLVRDLPEGSEIRLTADVDVKLNKTYHAFVPDLSVTFEADSDMKTAEAPDLREWRKLCNELRKDLEKWLSRLKQEEIIRRAIAKLDEARAASELDSLIELAGNSVPAVALDARRQASQKLGERHGTLRAIGRLVARDRIRWKLENLKLAAEGVELSRLQQLALDLTHAGDQQLAELESSVDGLNWDARIRAVYNVQCANNVANNLIKQGNAGSNLPLLQRVQASYAAVCNRYETVNRGELVKLVDIYETALNEIPGFRDLVYALQEEERRRNRLGLEAKPRVSDVVMVPTNR